jgi:hypothetical protein
MLRLRFHAFEAQAGYVTLKWRDYGDSNSGSRRERPVS